MKCKKCKNDNVLIQRVSETKRKKKKLTYWLFGGWIVDLVLWVFFTIYRLIWELIRPNKTITKSYKEAICQNCGFSWRVK